MSATFALIKRRMIPPFQSQAAWPVSQTLQFRISGLTFGPSLQSGLQSDYYNWCTTILAFVADFLLSSILALKIYIVFVCKWWKFATVWTCFGAKTTACARRYFGVSTMPACNMNVTSSHRHSVPRAVAHRFIGLVWPQVCLVWFSQEWSFKE